ncbi:hypothetical protein P7K49_028270 [Saguinus oedipus]|uniref:Laminin N-terminal domain-containing protein n=1 Tax=Saguinus oedipus TaxID=9490 RepID=A0ABQ9UBU6_SAGOE|nr:hypothetical protein P7K49_028270 [Saguinus oedipus]
MGQFCDYCNSEDPRKAHPVTNAIDGSERWWQSPPLSSGTQYNRVNLTLDLGQRAFMTLVDESKTFFVADSGVEGGLGSFLILLGPEDFGD